MPTGQVNLMLMTPVGGEAAYRRRRKNYSAADRFIVNSFHHDVR